MNILVLGAGVVGVTTAWYLRQSGHEVTVVERQSAAGLETSFANGGQISVSHAEPWANPHVIPEVLRWLGRDDAPLRVHWRWDPAFFAWGLSFLRACWPKQTEANIRAIVSLALYSRSCLQSLRSALSLQYDQQTRGILHVYTQPKAFSQARQAAALMNRFGLDRRVVSAAECVAIEPALRFSGDKLLGGDFTESDESGDAHMFTQHLAKKAAAAGVKFVYGAEILRLRTESGRVVGVDYVCDSRPASITADACVLALGSESPALAASLGLRLQVYPAKGYSATLDLADVDLEMAPMVSLTDDERKIVFSRLGQRLRIAGTAEFNGFNRQLDPVRCQALMSRARWWFPNLKIEGEPRFWCGLRPATPSNVPYVGGSGIPGLWLNTGHGTLGWTLSCGSASALAAMMSGQAAPVDFPFRRI